MIDSRLLATLDMMIVIVFPGTNQGTGKGIVIGIIIVSETVTMTVEILVDPHDTAKDQEALVHDGRILLRKRIMKIKCRLIRPMSEW
jgi:hypothetical protein